MTDVPLRDYIDIRANLLQEEMDRREASLVMHTEKAREEMNRRLNTMNEFRDAMRDQAARMMTRDTFELTATAERERSNAVHASFSDRLDKLESMLDLQRGRQMAYTALIALSGAVATIAVLIFTHLH